MFTPSRTGLENCTHPPVSRGPLAVSTGAGLFLVLVSPLCVSITMNSDQRQRVESLGHLGENPFRQ